MIKVLQADGRGRGNRQRISDAGETITAPLTASVPEFVELTAINVPGNVQVPLAGQEIVITDIVLYANRNVGVNDATVEIYEATSTIATASQRTIFKMEMAKQTNLPMNGLNWLVTAGAFINAITNDNEVFVNLASYYRPVTRK